MTVFGAIAASITYIRRLRDGREFRLAAFLLRVSMGGFVAMLLYMLIRGMNIPVNDYLAIFSSGVIGASADAVWELIETRGLGALKNILQKKAGGYRGDDTGGR